MSKHSENGLKSKWSEFRRPKVACFPEKPVILGSQTPSETFDEIKKYMKELDEWLRVKFHKEIES